MKHLKALLAMGILLAGLNAKTFGQVILPDVTVVSLNYKYIKSIHDQNSAQPVKLLQSRAASYNLKDSDLYEEDYDGFFVSFYIPDGEILASYDKDGKLISTAEKFKNVSLPPLVRKAVSDRYPGWRIAKDIYLVNYFADTRESSKIYKIVLENGDKRIRTKTNEQGEFLK
jgi:hypothetical protein